MSSSTSPLPASRPIVAGSVPVECVHSDSKRGMHSRAISTDSSASISTQCTQYTDFEPRRKDRRQRIDWCDLSSDEEKAVRPSVSVTDESQLDQNDSKDTVDWIDDSVRQCGNTHAEDTGALEDPAQQRLADLLLDDLPYQRRLDESHLRSLRLEGASTPTAYSDSDNEYYSFGILWVERDAFKSKDDDAAHPLFQPLTDFCLRRGASLKRFRSVSNLLRWLTKRFNGTRRAKRSYVCICAQESVSALEAFFQTWEDFVTVDGRPIIYSNQKSGDGETEVVVPRPWPRKSYFRTFADVCAQKDFPPKENVVWVQENERELTETIHETLQSVSNVLRFDTILDSIKYFTSRVDNSKSWRKKHEKQNLRVWPSGEPKYTVLCAGRAVALETFFRSWKSCGSDGPAEKLITYGEITEEEETRVIHRVFHGDKAVASIIEEVETSMSSIQDTMSVNYSQLSSEWSSQCGDWPSEPQTPHNRSEPGSRKRSSAGSIDDDVDISRTPSPILYPRWRPTGIQTPSIGCRLVVWRPQGLAPPRGIPAPSWRDTKSVAWARQPIARPATLRSRPSSSSPRQTVAFDPKRLSNDTKPKPLRSRPLQSPGVLKSAEHMNPRNRLCTAPLQAPPFPLLAPIQEEQ